MENIKSKIDRLRKLLEKWSKEYYEDDKPTVTDAFYDQKYQELRDLEKKHPQFFSRNSVTQKVQGRADEKFTKVKHSFPMLSLANANSFAELKEFDSQIKKQLYVDDTFEYIVEYKIDGLSISLTYENGVLQKAITRGDGQVGENVTDNVLQISCIPRRITYKAPVEFRGEIFMDKVTFTGLNESGNKFANPRNAASGTLRQIDSSIVRQRHLKAFVYSIPNPEDHNLQTQEEVLRFIKSLKLPVNNETKKVSSIDQAVVQIKSLYDKRYQLNYEIDGIVVKINDVSLYNDIGFTAKHPKFMIAYKFPSQVVQTKLLKIFPTVGRTGKITYNASLEKVKLAGSTVSAATLHNASYIKNLNLNEGDIVNITKANEIIPKVLSVSKKVNKQKWKEFLSCPSCHSQLQKLEDEADQYCINLECEAIQLAVLEHFVSRKAMNISFLSKETIKKFVSENLLRDIASIYKLKEKKAHLLKLERFGGKSVDNLLQAIETSKNTTLDKFLFALGIRHIGEKNAKILAFRFGTMEKVMRLSKAELASVANMGEKAVSSVTSFFRNHGNMELVKELISLGINLEQVTQNVSTIFEGCRFVITGTLSRSRDYFQKIIEENGGNLVNTLSKNTDYLILGQNPGTKYEKAKNLNTKILSEKELVQLLAKEDNER